jgi:hypothetical protein
MWTKLAFIAAFVALLFVADRVGATLLSRLILASNARVSALYDGRIDADVVIVGNSRGVHMAASSEWAKALCRPVFNLSLNGLDVATQDVLVRDFLDRNPAPKLMVIEISNLFSDTFMAPEYQPFIGESDRLAALIRSRQKTWFPWLDISHLYRFNSEYLLRALLFLVRPSDQTPEAIGEISPAKIDAFLASHPRYAVNPNAVTVFASTLEVLKTQGVEPVLVLAPYHPASFRVEDWRAKALAEVGRHLPADMAIHDWSLALPDDASFADPLHMAPEGRRVLAGRIAFSGLGDVASLCPATVGRASR